jgi:hypothetical protein
MTEGALGGIVIIGAFVFSILFFAWSLLLPTLRAMMSTALIADGVMGFVGTILLVRNEPVIGAIFLAASVVGFCVIAAAIWIRPASSDPSATETNGESLSGTP